MHPEIAGMVAELAVVVVVTAGSLAAIAVLAFKAMVRTRRLPPPALNDDRLEHLQQSVDAIAIEVERIAEAQRFTTKLLAERGEGSALDR